MVWNAASQCHEAAIPLPIGTHEFKLFLPPIDKSNALFKPGSLLHFPGSWSMASGTALKHTS